MVFATTFPSSSADANAHWLNSGVWDFAEDARHGSFREGEQIASLDDIPLSERFRCWRGRSGHKYIFSVYSACDCPAYRDAILIAVEVNQDETRRPLAFVDTGSFPEPVLSKLSRYYLGPETKLEFHVHLLANDFAKREQSILDLREAV